MTDDGSGDSRSFSGLRSAAGLPGFRRQHHIFVEGDDLIDAMVRDIRRACRTVLLETYILKEDRVGHRILDALGEAAKRRVEVRLRLDAFGSKGLISRRAIETLRNDGVLFSWCGLWNWRHPLQYQRRNHRKLLVIDEGIAYVGGFNIGEESSSIYRGLQRWRDTHIRLTGAIAKQAATLFRDFQTKRRYRREEWVEGALLMSNYGLACRYRWRCLLNDRFRMATKRIWLTTPYFVPDSGMQRRLKSAARRGVDVRVLVPEKSDVPIARWAARMSYGDILRAGVKIYEYGARVLHAKTILIDDDWSAIGTSNFDYRSFFTNYEINFLSRSPELNVSLAAIFADDLRVSRRVTHSSWSRRPYLQQAAELIGWMARRWL